jgi:zinc/manganese transport system substrate-binding protein
VGINVGFGVILVGLAVTACSQTAPPKPPGMPTVVASTDVWGSVASAVAGKYATVESIVTSAVDDPHSFEASPANATAIADASLVVINGGGYDEWADKVLAAHPKVVKVDAYSLLKTPEHPANEHVFYDVGVAKAVAAAIADRLAEADPAHAPDFRANAAEFGKQTDTIADVEHAIGQARPSIAVVSTEPVAHYLLKDSGVADITPETFTSAVEDGHDPAPADVAAMLDLLNSHKAAALLFNSQTQTPSTKELTDAAHRASVPVVVVTETLPADTDYLTWQRQTADKLAHALQPNR